MKWYAFGLGLIALSIVMLMCGKGGDNIVGSKDHQIETLRAYDSELFANGTSTEDIYVRVFDINGEMADSQKVVFETTHGSIDEVAITDHWGEATVTYTSEASEVDLIAEIKATVVQTSVKTLGKVQQQKSSPLIVELSVKSNRNDSTAIEPGIQNKKLGKINENTKTIQIKLIGITVSAEIEEPVLTADGISTTQAKIRLRETTSLKGINGEEVAVGLTDGTVTASAWTSYRGDADVTITAAEKAGYDTLVIEYGRKLSTFAPIQYVSPILTLKAEYKEVQADGESEIPINARLITHNNTPIIGGKIRFSSSAGTIEAFAWTDHNGNASVNLTAGEEANANVQVIATFLELSDTISVVFGSNFVRQITMESEPEPILRNGVTTKNITVYTINELSQAVPNAIIDLNVDYGTVPDSVITDEYGYASFEYVADDGSVEPAGSQRDREYSSFRSRRLRRSGRLSTGETGNISSFRNIENSMAASNDVIATITATTGMVQSTHEINLLGVNFQLSADPDSLAADGISNSVIKAVVKETTSKIAVASQHISFAVDNGTIATNAITNNQGVATNLYTSDLVSGTATITARFGTLSESVNVYVLDNSARLLTLEVQNSDPLIRDGTSKKTIRLYAENELNEPASNLSVSLNVNTGTVPGFVVTNENGIAEFEYTTDSDTDDAMALITATSGSIQADISITLVGISVSISAEPDSITADGVSTSQIRVEVKQTTSNVAVPGIVIKFASTVGAIQSSATTDFQGVATVNFTAPTTPSTATITATISELKTTVPVYLLTQEPKSIVFEEDTEPLLRDGLSTKQVGLFVYDELNNPVPNITISLSTDAGEIPQGVKTNEVGFATFEYVTDAAKTSQTATITAAYGALQETFPVELLGLNVEITATPDTLVADGSSTSLIRIDLKSASTNLAITNYPILFATNLGTISPSANTDAFGVATATFTSGITPGDAIITVILGKLKETKNVYISGDIPNDILLEAENSFIWVKETGNLEQTLIHATVLGASGNPVINEVGVQFQILRNPGGGVTIEPNDGDLMQSSVVKTVGGKASATVRAGIRAGTMQIRAELINYPEVNAQWTNIVIRSGPPYIWIDPGDPNNIISHTTLMVEPGKRNVCFANPVQDIGITVLLGDKYNNPVEVGTAVYFTTTGGVISTDAITNENGLTSVTLQNGYPFPTLTTNDVNQWAAHSIPNPNAEDIMVDISVPDFEGSVITNTEGNLTENDGVAYLLAYAWGKDQDNNEVKVWATTPVVYSTGFVHFVPTPDTYHLDSKEVANIVVRIWDSNGNPVAAGSTLSATTTDGELTVTSLIPDEASWGLGTTTFQTSLINNYAPEDSVLTTAIVTFELKSPNGSAIRSTPPITLEAMPAP